MRFASFACLLPAACCALAAPLRAQEEVAANPPACSDRLRLEAERKAVKAEIADIAMTGTDRRGRNRAAGAGKMAAGSAAALLLPFGIGLVLKGGMMVAEQADKKAKAKRPPPPEPNVPALIERQDVLERQLAELDSAGCPAAPSAKAKKG